MNDIRRCLSYSDVLLVPRNSELEHLSDANILYKYDKCSIPFEAVPVVNAPMDTVCSPELIKLLNDDYNLITTIHRWFDNADDQINFFESCNIKNNVQHCFLSVGIVNKWKEWIDRLLDYRNSSKINFGILVDVANGDTKTCVDTIEYLKSFLLNINIMAGNIATKSGFSRLQSAGADFIRSGVGGGAICSTRTSIGFGVPTLTTTVDCTQVKDRAYLISDGGVNYNGDIAKAIVAGADAVMVGKLFASTDLANNDKYDDRYKLTTNEKNYKYCSYRGMASKESISKLKSKKSSISVEGVSGLVPYQGKTQEVVENMLGNLRSAMAYYAGCTNWNEFKRKVKFIEITSQGWEESKTRVLLD